MDELSSRHVVTPDPEALDDASSFDAFPGSSL